MSEIYYTQTIYIASLIGGVAFALSGYLVGVRGKLDIMGIFILAFLTANGGGVLRDLLVGREPSVLKDMEPFWLVAGVVALAVLLRFHRFDDLEKSWIFVVCDSAGLVASAVTGALVGIEENIHFFGVLTLALLTATGGGIIRDMLVNRVPEVLHGGFYGSVALLLAGCLYMFNISGFLSPISIFSAFALAFAIRLVAYRRNWHLPKLL